MPPRPRPIPVPRKSSNAASLPKVTKSAQEDSKAMPPPPVPAAPMGILEPEVNALSGCLQNAAVKTAQVMRFHHDARQLNIRRHASDPPQSLQASLGRELEKYDQLCDAIEAHLIRAISVLQRDLKKEQQRIRDEEKAAAEAAAAAAAAKAEAEAAANAQTSLLPKLEPSGSLESITTTPISSTSHSPLANNIAAGRRPSTISISSLNRPAFPLKLDLSAQSLRMSAEDASFLGSGLRSPVTLAPKSARPIDYDIMAAFNDPRVDIDLTLPQEGSSSGMNLELNPNMGGSADKPIELDMDMDINMSDLFGDSSEAGNNDANADLFSPVLGETGDSGGSVDKVDNNFLSSIGVSGVGGDANADIFASFGVGGNGGDSTSRPDGMSLSTSQAAPSPGSLLTQTNFKVESFDLENLGDLDFLNNTDMNLDLWPMDATDGTVLDGDATKPSL
ncbi:hypothetical protein BT96DRAFT_970286 [Gymnopus androsaceus JB14]|uniref:Uncharacterized protein n=1 Tax=Gymnopus androsaceus JB14 TaxID=1447944 RepID=A0A6A4IJJ7_9AGAR|nr:hypothetical protein BT96DRAFT_970286 [Gymnopus androsaceus JB14]